MRNIIVVSLLMGSVFGANEDRSWERDFLPQVPEVCQTFSCKILYERKLPELKEKYEKGAEVKDLIIALMTYILEIKSQKKTFHGFAAHPP